VAAMTTRQLNRSCHAAPQRAEIDNRVALHTLRPSFATLCVSQNIEGPRHPGAAWSRQARHHGALYPRFHQDHHEVMSRLEHIALKLKKSAARLTAAARDAPGFGGCGIFRPMARHGAELTPPM